MKKISIVDRNDPVLRTTARPVPIEDIGSPRIKRVLASMRKVLHAEEDGVAIAAPQIGESLRIFIVSGKVFSIINARKSTGMKKIETSPDLVFINPLIIKFSKTKKKMEEGCLSVRWLYGQVKRSEKVTIKAYDEKGKLFVKGASNLLAQIFQHEVDHLDGVLFTDKAENVEDIPPKSKP